MNYITDNPKASLTAVTGLTLWLLNKFVFDFPPDVDVWIEIILASVASLLFGYYNRISTAQATVLKFPEVKAEVLLEEKRKSEDDQQNMISS